MNEKFTVWSVEKITDKGVNRGRRKYANHIRQEYSLNCGDLL